MTKKTNLDGDPQRHQLALGVLAAVDSTEVDSQLKCGTFCCSRRPEPRHMINGPIVFEGQA